MLNVNEYFDGKVKSIGFENSNGRVTAGVMDVGEYEFPTDSKETVTVTSGELTVKLPDSEEWKVYKKHESFIVESDKKFQLKVLEASAYVCVYE